MPDQRESAAHDVFERLLAVEENKLLESYQREIGRKTSDFARDGVLHSSAATFQLADIACRYSPILAQACLNVLWRARAAHALVWTIESGAKQNN